MKIRKQAGMSTIMMSAVLIFTVSLMSIYAAQVGVMEQKISANHYRGKQAFEAAQAGLDIALNEIDFLALTNLLNGNPNKTTWTHTELSDVLNESSGNQRLQQNITIGGGISNVTVSEYRLAMNLPNGAGDTSVLELTAYGYTNDVASPADDGSNANQQSTIRLIQTTTLDYPPPASIIAAQTVDINSSNVQVTNNSGDIMAAVWSGGNTIEGAATIDAGTDPSGGIYDNYAALAALDPDIKNDNGEAFFQNFFAMNKEQMKKRATVVDCSSNCTQADLVDGNGNPLTGVVWIDARNDNGTPNDTSDDSFNDLKISNTFELGNASNPVILIVDGMLGLESSNAKINGVVYTTQDLTMTDPLNAGQIVGSALSERSINVTENVSFTYDKAMFTNLQNLQKFYARIPGSWKDF